VRLSPCKDGTGEPRLALGQLRVDGRPKLFGLGVAVYPASVPSEVNDLDERVNEVVNRSAFRQRRGARKQLAPTDREPKEPVCEPIDAFGVSQFPRELLARRSLGQG
jgi:hypothetical protein